MGSRLAEQKVAAANQRKSLFPEPRRHFASALRCGCSVRLKGSIGRAEKLGGDAFRGLTVMHGWEEGSSRVLKQTLVTVALRLLSLTQQLLQATLTKLSSLRLKLLANVATTSS